MRGSLVLAVCLAAGLVPAGPADGLTPEQIVILVRRSDTRAAQLAWLYCERRGVPRERIVAVDPPAGDVLTQQVYRTRLVEPLRAELQRRKLSDSARCLLLAGSWPLKVEPDPPTAAEQRELKQLRDHLAPAALEIYQQGWRVEQIGKGNAPGRAPDALPRTIRNGYEAEKYYTDAVARAVEVVARLPDPQRLPLQAQLRSIRESAEGQSGELGPEPVDTGAADYAARHGLWQEARQRLKQATDKLAELESRHGTAALREERRRRQFEVRGAIGLYRQVGADIGELSGAGRSGALDSELALLWQDDYALNGGRPNPLFQRGAAVAPDAGKAPSVLMVARLDGFEPAQPVRLIDDAIAVEKAGRGLVGRFCVDGQGLASTDPLVAEDAKVLAMADWAARPADLMVVKETSLASPSAAQVQPLAFYVGWGQQGKFPSGYHCVQGAVAITCNASEADELHDPRSRRWANGWLLAGASVVIAGVDDCGPRSFLDFARFAQGLLVDGLPLAEAYWRATPFTSWRVILIGDPLYAPSAKAEARPGAAGP